MSQLRHNRVSKQGGREAGPHELTVSQQTQLIRKSRDFFEAIDDQDQALACGM